jgi:hypothetical protein
MNRRQFKKIENVSRRIRVTRGSALSSLSRPSASFGSTVVAGAVANVLSRAPGFPGRQSTIDVRVRVPSEPRGQMRDMQICPFRPDRALSKIVKYSKSHRSQIYQG